MAAVENSANSLAPNANGAAADAPNDGTGTTSPCPISDFDTDLARRGEA